MEKIIILGAGVTGIAAACRMEESNIHPVIYEQESTWGGLCNSFQIDGFTFDTFAHISFDKETRPWLEEQTECLVHEPEALNYDHGRWLRHPVQNNLCGLSVEERVNYIEGFINREPIDKPVNYGQWLKSAYGVKFAESYPYRYTRKYWTVEPEDLEPKWIHGRMYEPKLQEVLMGAITEKTPGVHYSKMAYYPKHGGFQALLEPMVRKCNIKCNKKVVRIDAEKKVVYFGDKSKVEYDQLISTIPLPELCKCLETLPKEISEAAEQLDYTTGVMLSLGLNKPNVSPALWYYIYDEDILPTRIYAPDWKSPNNVPSGCSAIQAEIYFSKYKPLKIPLEKLLEQGIEQLLKLNLFNRENIIVKDVRLKKYANVMFTPAIYSTRDKIHHFLQKEKIYYAGRFGEWDYLWVGQSLLSGRKVSEKCMEEMRG